MGNFIFYTFIAIIMAICSIINGVLGNWPEFTISTVAFIIDTAEAVRSFKNLKNKKK